MRAYKEEEMRTYTKEDPFGEPTSPSSDAKVLYLKMPLHDHLPFPASSKHNLETLSD